MTTCISKTLSTKLIKASLCETEIIVTYKYKKHVYKERKETTHVRVGERNIHPHIKRISTMYV